MAKKPVETVIPRWRYYLVMLALVSLPIVLVAKVAQLQIMPEAERGVGFFADPGRRPIYSFGAYPCLPRADYRQKW